MSEPDIETRAARSFTIPITIAHAQTVAKRARTLREHSYNAYVRMARIPKLRQTDELFLGVRNDFRHLPPDAIWMTTSAAWLTVCIVLHLGHN